MVRAVDNIKEALKCAQDGNILFQKAASLLSGGPTSYYFAKVEEYVNALFGRFAPFQVGHRVMLTAAPNTNNSWKFCAHFLIPGACGDVSAVDYSDGRFVADIVFDNESWIDDAGIEHLAENKHTFRIGESILTNISPGVHPACRHNATLDLKQALIDISILLVQLDATLDNNGIELEDEDAAVVAQIRSKYENT